MLGLSFTQPNLIFYHDHSDPSYPQVEPLLAEMRDLLGSLYEEGKGLVEKLRAEEQVASKLVDHISELRDGVGMLALRAKQVSLLYAATAPRVTAAEKQASLEQSRGVLDQATQLVSERERHYRAPMGRISGWREGPTVYKFGYLWTVHSLYYFWRDQVSRYRSLSSIVPPLCL